MNKIRVWLHCSVSTKSREYLLDYQESILNELANKLGLRIVGVSKDVI